MVAREGLRGSSQSRRNQLSLCLANTASRSRPAFFVSCQHSLTIKTLRAPVHALPPHSSAYSRSLSLSNVPSKHSLAMKHHIARGGERISGLPGTQNDRTLNTKTSLFLSEGETRPDLVRPLGRALLVQWFICQKSLHGCERRFERFESVSEKPAFFVSCQHSLTIKTSFLCVLPTQPHDQDIACTSSRTSSTLLRIFSIFITKQCS